VVQFAQQQDLLRLRLLAFADVDQHVYRMREPTPRDRELAAAIVAHKFDGSPARRAPGRPPIDRAVEQLIVRMAEENQSWGDDRIVGALANLGHEVSDQTLATFCVITAYLLRQRGRLRTRGYPFEAGPYHVLHRARRVKLLASIPYTLTANAVVM
jgi:hypothetical protein